MKIEVFSGPDTAAREAACIVAAEARQAVLSVSGSLRLSAAVTRHC